MKLDDTKNRQDGINDRLEAQRQRHQLVTETAKELNEIARRANQEKEEAMARYKAELDKLKRD